MNANMLPKKEADSLRANLEQQGFSLSVAPAYVRLSKGKESYYFSKWTRGEEEFIEVTKETAE